jgi:hypothetical protein
LYIKYKIRTVKKVNKRKEDINRLSTGGYLPVFRYRTSLINLNVFPQEETRTRIKKADGAQYMEYFKKVSTTYRLRRKK